MSRTFVIGDIHGAYDALQQCLSRSDIDYRKDRLICLGDICDRRTGVKDCVEELLKFKDLIMILGNHDQWALEWMRSNSRPGIWLEQGGSQTVESYQEGVPETHVAFFTNAKFYHQEGGKLFVHGGIDPERPIDKQKEEDFLWDRSLVYMALELNDPSRQLTQFKEVFVGHTPTISLNVRQRFEKGRNFAKPHKIAKDTGSPRSPGRGSDIDGEQDPSALPMQFCNVWLMDTGAGWPTGRLSMMDVESGEIFQSDAIEE